MKTFKDSKNNTWEISLTFGSIKRIRDLIGADLLDLEGGETPLITRYATDVYLLINTIFVLIKPQADRLNITDEQFGELLGGDIILAANTAFYEELQDFFRSSGRPDRVRAIAAQKTMIEKAIQKNDAIVEAEVAKKTEELFGK